MLLNSKIDNISMELDYDNATAIEINASQTLEYTPSKSGFIFMTGYGARNSSVSCTIGNVTILQQAASDNYVGLTLPVTKGVKVNIITVNITSNRYVNFVPYK